uniref:Uncharacterized protein n=1 Tax=viral metagenome TaxID=1070528 RepID=A0A6M3L9S0_9ZZZZ
MPNGRDHRKYETYGNHNYPTAPHQTSDCSFNCGCWAGPSNSGGPAGVSPFGKCPCNYEKDRLDLNFDQNMEDFINGKISYLESEIYRLKKFEKVYNKSALDTKIRITEENNKLISQLRKIMCAVDSHTTKGHDQLNELRNVLGEIQLFLIDYKKD